MTTNVGLKTVTVFVGARKNGHTAAASRRLLDNLEAFGDIRGALVFLGDYDLGVCRGCKICFLRGEEHCPLKGDRDALLEKMKDSDGVIFASPNFSFQVSSMMKMFLDRLGYVFHRPAFHGRVFTSLALQGFHGARAIDKYFRIVGAGLGFRVVRGCRITALEPMGEKERRRMNKALESQGRRFHRELMRPAGAAPSIFWLFAFRMGRNSVKRSFREGCRDFDYYRDRGWFDSEYFYPTHLGPLKKVLGAAFDGLAGFFYRNVEPKGE